jgi:hypothetical protein
MEPTPVLKTKPSNNIGLIVTPAAGSVPQFGVFAYPVYCREAAPGIQAAQVWAAQRGTALRLGRERQAAALLGKRGIDCML